MHNSTETLGVMRSSSRYPFSSFGSAATWSGYKLTTALVRSQDINDGAAIVTYAHLCFNVWRGPLSRINLHDAVWSNACFQCSLKVPHVQSPAFIANETISIKLYAIVVAKCMF